MGMNASKKEPSFLLGVWSFFRDCSSRAHNPIGMRVNNWEEIPAMSIFFRLPSFNRIGRTVRAILIPQKKISRRSKLSMDCSGGM